jgi:hypothetical protein
MILAIPLAGCVACASHTQPAGHGSHMSATSVKTAPMDRSQMWKNALARAPVAATGTFDNNGRLWLATVRNGHIALSHSDNQGKNFSNEARVNPDPEFIAADGENRPKIAFGARGEVYVSWTQSLETPFSGNIRFSRSLDGGRTFSAPITINDNRDAISHRFDVLGVNRRGDIHIAWLDKRDASAAEQGGVKFSGVSLYYAVSTDNGNSFSANYKMMDHTCECCRIAMDMDMDGVPVILWRHVFDGNVRDHALLRLDGISSLQHVSNDGWHIDACPHHGPALSISNDGAYHIAWFTNAPLRHGLFYARSVDQGKRFSAPRAFGNNDAQAGHAHILSRGTSVFIVWKEFDGTTTGIQMMRSDDNGSTWSAPVKVGASAGASDHPLLIADRDRVYLSWNTMKDGYRLIALGTAKGAK